jgi:hypothetical protein
MEKPTKEGLLAQEILVLVQKLGRVTKLLNGVLGGGAHHHVDVVHGVAIVLIPAIGALSCTANSSPPVQA